MIKKRSRRAGPLKAREQGHDLDEPKRRPPTARRPPCSDCAAGRTPCGHRTRRPKARGVRDRAAEPRVGVELRSDSYRASSRSRPPPARRIRRASVKGLHRFFHPADGPVFPLQHPTRVAVIRVNHPCWDILRSRPRQFSDPVFSSVLEYDSLNNHTSQHQFQGQANCNSDWKFARLNNSPLSLNPNEPARSMCK